MTKREGDANKLLRPEGVNPRSGIVVRICQSTNPQGMLLSELMVRNKCLNIAASLQRRMSKRNQQDFCNRKIL